ncbi:MAG: helix-turn-helix transcriptional regulator [Anaerolineaceae bacterium]
MNFSERLRVIRKKRGISQEEFAQSLEVSQRVISNWETGKHQPSIEDLVKISAKFDVDLNWLLIGLGESEYIQIGQPQETPIGQESEQSPDPEIYTEIPLYELEVAAGSGAVMDKENIITKLAFRKDWLRRSGFHGSDLLLVKITGDSMEPTLYDGGMILIDGSKKQIKSEKIYVFRHDDEGYVKRLRKSGDQVTAISDNRAYPEWQIPVSDVKIIGRVVWAARILP